MSGTIRRKCRLSNDDFEAQCFRQSYVRICSANTVVCISFGRPTSSKSPIRDESEAVGLRLCMTTRLRKIHVDEGYFVPSDRLQTMADSKKITKWYFVYASSGATCLDKIDRSMVIQLQCVAAVKESLETVDMQPSVAL